MSEEVIERVVRIAEELESLGASLESDAPPSFDDDYDEDPDDDPDNLKDWLDDNMGVHYTINDDLDVVGVVICVDWGGPNIYVDTLQRVVRGYWGLDEYSVALSEDLCESIDDWAQDRLERAIASR